MSDEVRIQGMPDVSTALQLIAKRLKMSVTMLVNAGGVDNGSLTSIGTGQLRTKDMSVGPLLRVLRAVSWEMAGRSRSPQGIILRPEGGIDMLVCGADGGRLDIPINSVEDIRPLLITMAAANGLTVTGLNNVAKLGGASLVSLAKGTSANQDARLSGLIKIVEAAQFELIIRPVHATRRDARAALAATRHG